MLDTETQDSSGFEKSRRVASRRRVLMGLSKAGLIPASILSHQYLCCSNFILLPVWYRMLIITMFFFQLPGRWKVKSETSEGINQRLPVPLLLLFHVHSLELTQGAQTSSQRGWEVALIFLAVSQGKAEDSLTRKKEKNICRCCLCWAYNGIQQTPASSPILLLFNVMVIYTANV